MLADVRSPSIGELVLSWCVVDADLVFLDQRTDGEEPQGYMLCSSTIGPVVVAESVEGLSMNS